MMDVQMAPPPYTAAGSFAPPVGKPPVLGSQIPGTTGGLPATAGLSATANPMAQQLQSMGRGDDKMLVHMTPDEVNSLQGLALASGGSLTINPQTGLPEAGWLGKLLPTILGAALAATGVGAPLAAGIVGAGQFIRTGSLQKGLMAGLGAFGGASLAGGVGLGGSLSKTGFGTLSKNAGIFGSNMGAGAGALSSVAGAGAGAGNVLDVLQSTDMSSLGNVAQGAGQTVAKRGLAGIAQRFGQTAARGLPGGIVSRAAPMVAASGLMQGISNATTPSGGGNMGGDGVIDNSFTGPYTAQVRSVSYPGRSPVASGDSSEHLYFSNSMPEVYNVQGQVVQPGSSTARGTPILQNVLNPNARRGQNRYNQIFTPYMTGPAQDEEDISYAGGGEVELADGAFVLDARTVSEIGNGSSNAGMEALRRIGGRPIDGPGDGVSDSIPARIGRDQPARVARDEVLVPADAVRRLGKGNPKKGADKLYSLMNKAHKARKKAKRGQDTKVRSGLA
jgi:hypothetical protein